MELCSSEIFTQNFSYFASNFSDQNCGCNSCIRRCCKPGFVYRQQFCYYNSSDFLKVSVYTNTTVLVNILSGIENFLIGVPNCVLFRLNYPSEEFYIQSESKDVWVPTYNKFYNSNRYCVDELDGFTPFLCFNVERNSFDGNVVKTNTLGKKFYILIN